MCKAVRQSPEVLSRLLLVAAVLFTAVSAANAEFVGAMVTVTATSDYGSASQEFAIPGAVPPRPRYVLPEAISLHAQGGELIGTVEELLVELDGDPQVNLNFAVAAGNTATTFEITSAVISFWPLVDVTGFASAAVTLTDGDPLPGNGASLALTPGHTGLYHATYNSSATFCELLDTLNWSGPGGTSDSENSGVQAIPGPVQSIEAGFSFQLSANDHASGTSRFEVIGTPSDIPEPSVFAMMAFGLFTLLLGLRRR